MDISTTFKSGLNSAKTTLGGLWWTIKPLQGIQKVRGIESPRVHPIFNSKLPSCLGATNAQTTQ